ncbi:T9SS type A sorting domain-containing protein [Marinirhabdus gelatinilytica]|uniref:Putative secreted protein (Por secretion system target) n=1 Tax=Marinirhabdus gelatinilytica TaxID=1703343 RepID=A0A370QA25_9FLAO|nr:T9SS type A sorting domain-containing protein [Marinirhabdus gelatinilytica]RDK85241.1 putative secreted protein (Por secretion system target) [Marinirhabdus gelatinilytica]
MKNKLLLKLALVLLTQNVFSQEVTTDLQQQLPKEKENMPYEYINRQAQPQSLAYEQLTSNYFTKQVNIAANGNNIVGDAANEPSLAVDPTNPDRIVVGWRQFDDVGNDFRQAGYGYSTNGGYDWTFPGVLDPGLFRSDPVLDFDNDGNFFYNSLQGSFECDVFAIRDGGVDWEAPVPAKGGDKQWMRIDRTGGPSAGYNYSYWNRSFSTCPGAFTRSTDQSNTFEDCLNIPGDPFWGTLAVDADANLYLTGTNGGNIVVIKSTTASNPAVPVTFTNSTTANLDGNLSVGEPINPQGLVGQAWVDVDVSFGAGHNNVYVVASVERNSNGDPADVMFARSTDGGNSFEAPVRINTDTGSNAYQWFGTMAVAPNGRIDVIWLDTRDAAGGFDSVLYYSFSEDQGDTWSPNTPISEPFDPTIGYPVQQKMGDYMDMKSDNNFAHIAWCGTFTGGQDVYYTKVSPDGTLGIGATELYGTAFTVSPNPVLNETTIGFSVFGNTKTTVNVYDLLGRKVTTLLDATVEGPQKIVWDATNTIGAKVTAGVYFVTVTNGGTVQTKKIVIH